MGITVNDAVTSTGPMRLLVTGGTGALGRAFCPLAQAAGHHLHAPGRHELDLFDPVAVAAAVSGVDAVIHLATRIQPLDQLREPGRVARERSPPRRRIAHPRRRGARELRRDVCATDGHLRLSVRGPRLRGHPGRHHPGDPPLGARGENETDRFARDGRRGISSGSGSSMDRARATIRPCGASAPAST